MDKFRIILFGMTGFGNNALKTLIRQPIIDILGVFTSKRQDSLFPYYECDHLHKIVQSYKIPLYECLLLREGETIELIKNLSPDLIVVSTFNQIIPQSIISLPKLGVINIHPSLLPKYRGATPTVWVLMNGEEETGITIHFIEDEKIDNGRVITQARLRIEPYDTDGSLRYKLAELSEKVLIDALLLISKKNKEVFPPQNESEATYFPKRTLKDGEINLEKSFKEIFNKVRAMSPYPRAYLKYKGKNYIVKGVTKLDEKPLVNIKVEGEIVFETEDGILKFQVKEENGNVNGNKI